MNSTFSLSYALRQRDLNVVCWPFSFRRAIMAGRSRSNIGTAQTTITEVRLRQTLRISEQDQLRWPTCQSVGHVAGGYSP